MRKTLWPVLMLLLFAPGFALVGAFAAADNTARTVTLAWPSTATGKQKMPASSRL